MRQSTKRRMHNRITKKVIKTLTKRTLESVAENDLEKAAAAFKQATAKIDKAGARRVLHPNTAARRRAGWPAHTPPRWPRPSRGKRPILSPAWGFSRSERRERVETIEACRLSTKPYP